VDTYGNKLSDDTSVTVNLYQDLNASFYSDSECSSGISSINISIYNDSADLYVIDNTVEDVTLTAVDNASVLSPDNKLISVMLTTSWWDTDWTQRVRININNLDQATTLSDIPVLIKLNSSRINYNNTKDLAEDLRFIDSDDATPLSYEIESWNKYSDSYIWVNIPSIQASSNDTFIYMYFGNDSAFDAQDINNVWNQYWGVWHLGEDPEDTAPQFADSTSNSNHGTAENSPLSASAIIGNGVEINNSYDTIDVGTNLTPMYPEASIHPKKISLLRILTVKCNFFSRTLK